jgi:glycosyltransferase involved in cell wall biosynthesis
MTAKLVPPWHIAHVIGSLQVGGSERQLLNYLLAANQTEFRHTVLCLSRAGELADQLQDSGIAVMVRPVRRRLLLPDLIGLSSWLRAQKVVIVHTHMFYAALWGRLASLLAGVPVRVSTEHGKELWKSRWQIWMDRRLSRTTCRHIAVSQDGLRIRLKRERVRPDKILHIPNGVTVPAEPGNETGRLRIRRELGLNDDQPVLGSVGRVVAAKGYGDLLAAFGRLRQRFSNLHWLLVGDGPELPTLRRSAEQAGLAAAISFVGFRSDIADLLSAMDVFVMSSIREGLPLALLEAMAARKSIVVTDVGGMPEVVQDGVSGLVASPADPESLAAAIGSLVAARDLANRLAEKAYQRAQGEFSSETIAARIEQVYTECLASKGLGS